MPESVKRGWSEEHRAYATMEQHPAAAASVFAAVLELEDSHDTRGRLAEWLTSPTRDISARLLHRSRSSESPGPALYGSSPPKALSQRTTSSMAPACLHQSSTASTHPPSLSCYSDATPTETSISTGVASHLPGLPLLEEEHGVLVRPVVDNRPSIFHCCFWFLNCSYISDDAGEWQTHCLSHFRDREPPKSVECPLCEDFKYTSDSGRYSWDRRMDHLANQHLLLGETLRAARPEFKLFKHLWGKKLIDDQDLKELMGGNHNLTRTPSTFTVTGGQRERRRSGQLRQHVRRPAPPGTNMYRPS